MASAVLASRNEPTWGQSGGGFMGKQLPYSNHLNPNPSSNNPNSNSLPKKKKFHSFANGHHNKDDSPAVTQTASDDAYSSIGSKSGGGEFNRGDYVSFKIGSCTRNELVELKKRLVAELEQIQRLNDQIDSGNFQPQSVNRSKKRPNPLASPRDPKRFCQTNGIGTVKNAAEIGELMKMCRQVLTKLMKIKSSWIFKAPVDTVGLGLHDYHQIIKRPMDLGTVKSNFSKNFYTTPADFAADVRLTFENAMLYNPRGDEVHKIAEQLLARFEDLYRPIKEKYGGGDGDGDRDEHSEKRDLSDELQGSSWNSIQTPERTKKMKTNPMPIPPPVQSPVHTPSPVQAPPVKPVAPVGRTIKGKQPKPKARDPNKRPMSMEEKQKLGVGLQGLPEEKMPQLVQIIRKRNKHMAPEGDEIELDIEAIDTETLWELDRFVTNWKKMESKNKRQALMGIHPGAATTASGEDNVLSVNEKIDTVKKPKKGEVGEEDVDIGDEMPMSSFPPVEIEKDDVGGGGGGRDNKGHATSSSSSSSGGSSSDSSSSSDSDSGSSSGSDSDADDAESRGVASKGLPKT